MAAGCVLVTGGAGFVGSHSVVELVSAGYSVVALDNLVNASMESMKRVELITGQKIPAAQVDLLDKAALQNLFKQHKFTSVIHFAGLKAVGESCELPLLYYRTNVGGTMNLLEVMKENNLKNLIFSSSATVYGTPQYLPLDEKHPVGGCTNPYGKTKYFIEEILRDLAKSDPEWNIVMLRYFNPVGAHKSGTIGEDPQGPPNNLMPYIAQTAVGKRKQLSIFGSDYDTPDGTGVRDYIHVVDLAVGHVAAQKKLEEKCGLKLYNLGTGNGLSVLDMVKAFEKASGKTNLVSRDLIGEYKGHLRMTFYWSLSDPTHDSNSEDLYFNHIVPYNMCPRRGGDIASCYADAALAEKELGWKATRGLDEMCEDLWRWQSQNPNGYKSS